MTGRPLKLPLTDKQIKVREYNRRYHQAHGEEFKARQRQTRIGSKGRVLTGLHKRPHTLICEICGHLFKMTGYHHWDDNNPSKGVWICNPCHKIVEMVDAGEIMSRIRRYVLLKLEIEGNYAL